MFSKTIPSDFKNLSGFSIFALYKITMELKLTRPICFFDLETTGIDVARDRIVEISIFKVYPNGNKESKTWLVNPTIPIPPQTTAVHGITNEKVANEPTFKELAFQIHNMIKDSDLAGFNSDRFDIPLLAEEYLVSFCQPFYNYYALYCLKYLFYFFLYLCFLFLKIFFLL